MVIVQNPSRPINYDNFISVAVCGSIGSWLSSLYKRYVLAKGRRGL